MSQPNNKYRRLEALLSDSKPADPNPASPELPDAVHDLRTRIAALEADLAQRRSMDSQAAAPIAEVVPEPISLENRAAATDSKSIKKSRLPRFLMPPVFEGDTEKTSAARLLHQITLACWSLPLLGTVVSISNVGMRPFVVPVDVILALTLALIMRLNRAANVRFASMLLVSVIFTVLTYLNFTGAAEPRPLMVLSVVAIMISGLLLGSRGAIVAAVALSLQHVVILVLASKGIIVAQFAGATPLAQNALVTSVSYLLIALLLRLAISRIQSVVQQLRENQADLQLQNRELEQLSKSLELRVSDRTHDLILASEVGRTIAEKVRDVQRMLADATEMIRASFDLYYTQVYLLDATERTLVLQAGTGDVGKQLLRRGHQLSVDSASLNARAVYEMKPVLVEDTSSDRSFLPNPLLPGTRSEMVVPLIVSGRVLGVLDMQSERPAGLTASNMPAFEALAGQLAIALQNAELFAESERARAELESQARQLTRAGWAEYLNGIHRPERTGYAFAQNQLSALSDAQMPAMTSDGTPSFPIEILGEAVGKFQISLEAERWSDDAKELVASVAQQLARQVENLRLLEDSERYRAEAEEAMRHLTREGWQAYASTRPNESTGFVYDAKQVRPLEDRAAQALPLSSTYPLTVRDEVIGNLAVDSSMPSTEVAEIIAAVSRQLSAHIENIRLSDQNQNRAMELEQMVAQLRELDRLKSSFLANMSHELRTPLNSILGFADVLLEELDGPLTENMSNDLSLIQRNGQHLLHLINDVLDMAKIEAGKMNLTIEKFRLASVVEEVTHIAAPLASNKSLSLSIESGTDAELEIQADRMRLLQVLINVVNNAVKFTDRGQVVLRTARENEHVVISVTDTGIGIPPALLESVFLEFTQVDASSTRKAGGTGLGLPISRRLVEMHGGRIWAESTGVNGQGTTVYVSLPADVHVTAYENAA